MTQFDSQSAISAIDDRQVRVINVEKWGGEVRIKELSAGGRIDLAKYQKAHPDMSPGELLALLAAVGIVDEQGKVIYGLEKLDELLDRNMEALEVIGMEMIDLCKLGLQAVEEEEKNSEPTSGEGSATS